jgi:hypothetical protein
MPRTSSHQSHQANPPILEQLSQASQARLYKLQASQAEVPDWLGWLVGNYAIQTFTSHIVLSRSTPLPTVNLLLQDNK